MKSQTTKTHPHSTNIIITTAVTSGAPYEDEVPAWENHLTNLGYGCTIGRLENHNHWMANCLQKPAHILKLYKDNPDKGILWLDVDIRVMKPMDLIFEKAEEGFDFLCHETKAFKLHRRGWWLNAGVLYFSPSERAERMLETWAELCALADADSWMPEQNALADAYYKVHPSFYSLPQSYNCDWDAPEASDAVIIQEKISRKYKGIIDSGKQESGIKEPITVKQARKLNEE